ncbi:MAG: trimethylamine methyltransferase family protein [Proteobacteria bacterium]|nr:trimethylamine methyltransferase family protein [Pseudomonadota bacterium]MBU1697800.1 trimethylamine methyltransferase family protein [Pseudomonadota bacterium]
MNRVLFNFDREVLDQIHNYSLELLNETGIRFPNREALEIFKRHGLKTDGKMVFFKQKDIEKSLETVPKTFKLHARNEDNSFVIGDDSYRMAPGYGPPFIIEKSGEMRHAVLDDTKKFCKLVQTSKALDFNSSIVAQPNDVPAETAHLDMLLSTMLLTDKPLMGSTSSKSCARDSLEMAEMVWGKIDKPVMINLVDSLSPLQYAQEMVDALLVYAKAKQPLIIHSSCSLGTSGPITIAGSLVLSNACTLAGICLTQLVNPGTPIVYGLGGSPTDMRTGGYINASPEDAKHTAIVAALGRYYHIPCRSQGALTESFGLDYQAGMESSMMLTTAALSGVHVSLHACGTYGSMLAMSFEKFLADEDLCRVIKTLMKPVELSEDAFAMDLIKKLGTSGAYLLESHTAKRCRSEFFIPDLNIRTIHSKWLKMEHRQMDQRASQLLEKRLSAYEKPDIDPSIEKDLIRYVENKKQ